MSPMAPQPDCNDASEAELESEARKLLRSRSEPSRAKFVKRPKEAGAKEACDVCWAMKRECLRDRNSAMPCRECHESGQECKTTWKLITFKDPDLSGLARQVVHQQVVLLSHEELILARSTALLSHIAGLEVLLNEDGDFVRRISKATHASKATLARIHRLHSKSAEEAAVFKLTQDELVRGGVLALQRRNSDLRTRIRQLAAVRKSMSSHITAAEMYLRLVQEPEEEKRGEDDMDGLGEGLVPVEPPVDLPSGSATECAQKWDLEALIKGVGTGLRPLEVQRIGAYAVDGGGFSDIWRGKLQTSGQDVALKSLRAGVRGTQLYKRIVREVSIWSRLHHTNVLPFLGLGMPEGSTQICMISPWMARGNATCYLESHPSADRISLIRGIGEGISYLHSSKIVHGDLKAANILISPDLTPCLADFGLSIILEEEVPHEETSTAFAGSSRWRAPEWFEPERFQLFRHSCLTPPGDVYSFGMTIFEIMAGGIPYAEIKNNWAIAKLVLRGRRPFYPGCDAARKGLSWNLWHFVLQSWRQDPSSRCSLAALEDALQPDGDDPPCTEPNPEEFREYWV